MSILQPIKKILIVTYVSIARPAQITSRARCGKGDYQNPLTRSITQNADIPPMP
jgi:hypothetical protein